MFRLPSPLHPPLPFLILTFLALAGVPGAVAQDAPSRDLTLSVGTPEEVGLSPAILQAGVQLYREAVEQGDLVGAVLLVAKDGKVVLHEAVGQPVKGLGRLFDITHEHTSQQELK